MFTRTYIAYLFSLKNHYSGFQGGWISFFFRTHLALASSFIFGITIAISVGPIAMLIINRSINCGVRTGILSGNAAAFADLTYGIISFAAGSAIYALTIANPLIIVAFTGFAAQSAISGFSTILFSSAALFAGSLLIQLTLALFGRALKVFISKTSVILYMNVLSGFSIISLGLMKMF